MTTLEEMLELIFSEITDGIVEEMPLAGAVGCELAEDLTAETDQPPFPRSPLDGYAVRSADLAGASPEQPAVLTVVGEVMAGAVWQRADVRPRQPISVPGQCPAAFSCRSDGSDSSLTDTSPDSLLQPGEAVRIMTGAPIPAGADCVVKQEDTDCGEDVVRVFIRLVPWQNYCPQGEDFHRGDCLIRRGTLMNAAAIAAAAAAGRSHVRVFRRPRIAVFSTGDELTEPGLPLLPGKIYNANLALVRARLTELGLSPFMTEQAEDSKAYMAERLLAAAAQADLIITTGGVSVGKKDIMHGALQLAGARKLCWRMRLKPGMPTLSAVIKKTNGQNLPVLALSGNPFAVQACMEVLVRPVLARLWHKSSLLPRTAEGTLTTSYDHPSPVRRLVRAIYDAGSVTIPAGSRSSGVIGSLSECNCLIDIPEGTRQLRRGDRVHVLL